MINLIAPAFIVMTMTSLLMLNVDKVQLSIVQSVNELNTL